jgi:hypothetical protein
MAVKMVVTPWEDGFRLAESEIDGAGPVVDDTGTTAVGEPEALNEASPL